MKPWLRLLLVTVSVGGGFTGMAVITSAFAHARSLAQMMLLVVFFGAYGFVTAGGLAFVYDPRRIRLLAAALTLQIPWISSPIVVYQFAAGVSAAITVGTPEEADRIGVHFGWNLFFGAHFLFRFGSLADVPISAGLNLAAVVLLVLLVRANRKSTQTPNIPLPITDPPGSAV